MKSKDNITNLFPDNGDGLIEPRYGSNLTNFSNELDQIDTMNKIVLIGPDFPYNFLSWNDCNTLKQWLKNKNSDFFEPSSVNQTRNGLKTAFDKIDWTNVKSAFDLLAKKPFVLYFNFTRLGFLEESFEKVATSAIIIRKGLDTLNSPVFQKSENLEQPPNNINHKTPFVINIFNQIYPCSQITNNEFTSIYPPTYKHLSYHIRKIVKYYSNSIKIANTVKNQLTNDIYCIGFDWNNWYWDTILELLTFPDTPADGEHCTTNFKQFISYPTPEQTNPFNPIVYKFIWFLRKPDDMNPHTRVYNNNRPLLQELIQSIRENEDNNHRFQEIISDLHEYNLFIKEEEISKTRCEDEHSIESTIEFIKEQCKNIIVEYAPGTSHGERLHQILK